MGVYPGPRGIQKEFSPCVLSDSIAGFGVFRSPTRTGHEQKFGTEIAPLLSGHQPCHINLWIHRHVRFFAQVLLRAGLCCAFNDSSQESGNERMRRFRCGACLRHEQCPDEEWMAGILNDTDFTLNI